MGAQINRGVTTTVPSTLPNVDAPVGKANVAAGATPTKAEFDALVGIVNTLVGRLQGKKGLNV